MTAVEINRLIAELSAKDLPTEGHSSVDLALLAYAEKLTLAPAAIVGADIDVLRSVGLSDREIHDACAIVAYFAFVNRIAGGLGVELEPPNNQPAVDG